MVELLTNMARAERGATAADFMPQHVKNAAEREALHCEKIASLLIALDAERGRMREALANARPIVWKWCNYQGNTQDVFDLHVKPIDDLLARSAL
jgi:hypothetical protein